MALQEKKTVNKRRNIKEIRQLDSNGNLVAVYDSVKKAAAITGISKSYITNVFYGFNKAAAGYRWEAVYYQPGKTKQVVKKENPSRLSEEMERETEEYLEKVNGGTKIRRCVGINNVGEWCNATFLSEGKHERKCPRCQGKQEVMPQHKLFAPVNRTYLLQHNALL